MPPVMIQQEKLKCQIISIYFKSSPHFQPMEVIFTSPRKSCAKTTTVKRIAKCLINGETNSIMIANQGSQCIETMGININIGKSLIIHLSQESWTTKWIRISFMHISFTNIILHARPIGNKYWLRAAYDISSLQRTTQC